MTLQPAQRTDVQVDAKPLKPQQHSLAYKHLQRSKHAASLQCLALIYRSNSAPYILAGTIWHWRDRQGGLQVC